MINHEFLTAATVSCLQAGTSIPSTAWPVLRSGLRMTGMARRPDAAGRPSGSALGLGGRG